VIDLLTGARYNWGESNYIRLDPQIEPAHILRIESRP
jgi:starch synthase (maltosyl-transferring)